MTTLKTSMATLVAIIATISVVVPAAAYADGPASSGGGWSSGGYIPETYSSGGFTPTYNSGGHVPDSHSSGGYIPEFSSGGYIPEFSSGGYIPEYYGCEWGCADDLWVPPVYGCSYDCGYYEPEPYYYTPTYSDFSVDWYWYEYEYEHEETYDACSNISGNQPSGYNCYPPQHDYEPVCAIDASDKTIEEGDSTTLHWTSERATSATLSGYGSVSTGGSRSVSPNNDETYTLTVRDNDGDTDTCSVTIRVEEEEHDDDEPWCKLDVSENNVEEGDRVTLEWDTRNADYASINEGIGRVDEDGGTERVEIDDDTTFRMTVRDNDGDEDTCSVTVRVDEENDLSGITFYGEPTNNPPTVYLSSLPYTGLEDVTPEMWAFWLTLIAGAGAVGTYFMTHGMPLAFATAVPMVMRREEAEASETFDAATELNDALTSGNTDAAIELMRQAAVNGTGVEELISEARTRTEDEALATRLDAVLAAAKETGIRGAKEALAA